jgi:hypothetical protein
LLITSKQLLDMRAQQDFLKAVVWISISQPNVMGEQRKGNVNQRKGMIRFPLKAKRRQQVVLGCHLIGLQETLCNLTTTNNFTLTINSNYNSVVL